MSWLLRARFQSYEILDHSDLRDRTIARRPVPILDDRAPVRATSEDEPPPTRQPEPEIPVEMPQLELTCEIEETPQIELTVEIV